MPRYFFDAYDGRQHCIDRQGEELENDQEARAEALAIVHALIKDDRHFGEGSSYHVSVRRDEIAVVYQIGYAMTGTRMVSKESNGAFPSLERLVLPSDAKN